MNLHPCHRIMLQNSLESTTNDDLPVHDDHEYRQLKKYISHDPISIDELAEDSGLTIDQVSSMLLILELQGEVESLSGGRYSLLSQ